MNRHDRLAVARQQAKSYLRLIPLFLDEKGDLVDGQQTYVLHTKVGDVRVATVPAKVASISFAQNFEQKLTDKFGQDVLIVSDNIKFFRVEEVEPKEVAAYLKGPDHVDRPAVADAPAADVPPEVDAAEEPPDA